MAFNELDLNKIEYILKDYIIRNRPPEDIRDEIDFSYRIEDQNIFISTIRCDYQNPSKKITTDNVKLTYVKKLDRWKIYWQRYNLKWDLYKPYPEASSLDECIKVYDEDTHCCFRG